MSSSVIQSLEPLPDADFNPIAVLGLKLAQEVDPIVTVYRGEDRTYANPIGEIRISGTPKPEKNLTSYYTLIHKELIEWLESEGLTPQGKRYGLAWRSDYTQRPSERPIRKIGMIVVARSR